MNTEQKLNKIRAKCVELLAIAEKRTQGKWEDDGCGYLWVDWKRVDAETGFEGEHITLGRFDKGDFDFIASCAGPAEAGWKATIAAIDIVIREVNEGFPYCNEERIADEIIAAWEGLV